MTAKSKDNKAKPEIKYLANPPTNPLAGRSTIPFDVQNNGQRLTLTIAKSKQTALYITGKDAEEFSSVIEKTINSVIEAHCGFEIPMLYDMILIHLHDTGYKSGVCSFKYSDICDLLGVKRSHADRIKPAFYEAATLLRYTTLHFKTARGIYDKNMLISVGRLVDDDGRPNARLEIEVNPSFLAALKDFRYVIARDTALFTAQKRYGATYVLGRYFEDLARRQKKSDEVKASVASIMEYLKYLVPEYLTEQRYYAKRLEWIKKQLTHLKDIGFMDWEPSRDWKHRPQCLNDEPKSIITCRFVREHRLYAKDEQSQKSAK